MPVCECGCGQSFERENRKGAQRRFISGHQFHTPEARVKYLAGKRAQRLTPPADYPTDGLCMCGCGQKTDIATYTNRPRDTYIGYPLRYIHGHTRKRTGPDHHQFKGRQVIDSGYVLVYAPEHPGAYKSSSRRGYVLEHRLVWEQTHGKLLDPNMHVHHINGIRDDNRPENLVALTRSEHMRLHAKERHRK